MNVTVYEQSVHWDKQRFILSALGIHGTATAGQMTIPTLGRAAPTTTVSDVVVVTSVQRGLRARPVDLEQWLDLWISRRYAGGAIPLTLEATQAIHRDVMTIQRSSDWTPNGVILPAYRMIEDLKSWTGAPLSTLAKLLGVRSTKTLYNWRDRPRAAPRPMTSTRLLRIHALIRAITINMGPMDGRAWLLSGNPSPLELLAQGDIATVEQLALNADIHPGKGRRRLSLTEADALRRGGLHVAPPTPDLLATVAVRTAALTEELLRTGLTVQQAAERLGTSVADIRRLIDERKVYAVTRDGEWILPDFQFDGGRLIRGVEEVMPLISRDAHVIEVFTWFTSPSTDLEDECNRPLSPRDWLRAGGSVDPVITLATDL